MNFEHSLARAEGFADLVEGWAVQTEQSLPAGRAALAFAAAQWSPSRAILPFLTLCSAITRLFHFQQGQLAWEGSSHRLPDVVTLFFHQWDLLVILEPPLSIYLCPGVSSVTAEQCVAAGDSRDVLTGLVWGLFLPHFSIMKLERAWSNLGRWKVSLPAMPLPAQIILGFY